MNNGLWQGTGRGQLLFFSLMWPRSSFSPHFRLLTASSIFLPLAVSPHRVNCLSLVTQVFLLAPILGAGWFGTGWAVLAEGKLKSTKAVFILILFFLHFAPRASHLKISLNSPFWVEAQRSLLLELCPTFSAESHLARSSFSF